MTTRRDPLQGRCTLALLVAAAFFITLLGSSVPSAEAWGAPAPPPAPSESECRPYIEKALKEIEGTDSDCDGAGCDTASKEASTEDDGGDASTESEGQIEESNDEAESKEGETAEETSKEDETKEASAEEATESKEVTETAESQEVTESATSPEEGTESQETKDGSGEESQDETKEESVEEAAAESTEEAAAGSQEEEAAAASQEEGAAESQEEGVAGSQEEGAAESQEDGAAGSQEDGAAGSQEDGAAGSQEEEAAAGSQEETGAESKEETKEESAEDGAASADETKEASAEEVAAESKEDTKEESAEEAASENQDDVAAESKEDTKEESVEEAAAESKEESVEAAAAESKEDTKEESTEAAGAESTEDNKEESAEDAAAESKEDAKEGSDEETKEADSKEGESAENAEEDLTMEIEVPENLRPRDHIAQILKLDAESAETEMLLQKTVDVTLRELKRLYDSAIKPLEILYKYRDLSNRHFGDPEIFSKPLILFMGPWSGGKSTIINYLLGTEFTPQSIRTGAEPSPAYFNILMYGERYEVLDGTQLAADWTFSGLQKFGQGLLDRLRGVRLNNPLLEKVNIVEIPGILEIRKQVERVFPFNDACQWFIDRADIIFLVYDPSKLDVGPETEAILDQLKGREYQTRIILNKADQVKPEELMRVQGTLIWNISPLMSSAEPPVMYSTSLWSMPYESGAPLRLLSAQEKAFLRDLRTAFEKRVENKIASARRFAVRVRNHAKMVDCYLTTYYNHKSFFGNKKKVSDDIIEHPQDYHIYEGLSTLTNISRYDLPDPDSYRDFFKLNPLFEFQQLAATCTYFRGCPINRLDVAIAYDLPELVGKYKSSVEDTLDSVSNSNGPPKS